jgi:hypothetical protein
MSKPVKDLVNKQWAKAAKELLTGYSPDCSALFTKLQTLTLEHQQSLKSQAARKRFDLATRHLQDAVKFGWAFGLNATQTRFTRPAQKPPIRRISALLPLAITAGEAIGKAQAKAIERAHRIPRPLHLLTPPSPS